jgi:hypothetical protein
MLAVQQKVHMEVYAGIKCVGMNDKYVSKGILAER